MADLVNTIETLAQEIVDLRAEKDVQQNVISQLLHTNHEPDYHCPAQRPCDDERQVRSAGAEPGTPARFPRSTDKARVLSAGRQQASLAIWCHSNQKTQASS